MIFFVLAWVVVGAASAMNISANQKMIGVLAIAGSLIFTAYGIWNAFTPVVAKLDASIENLPQNWKGKKVVQISDVHLGHIYSPDYMDKIAEKINYLHPDMILITGDLFDGTDGNLDIFLPSLKKLNAPQGVFYITGNHETYLGVEKVKATLEKTSIVFLDDAMKNVEDLQIVGVSYPERMESKNISETIKSMPEIDSKKPSILLWHSPTQIESAKNLGISFQLSGHTHKGQIFPYGFITSLIYHGYDFGYKKEGIFSIYTSSGLGTWGPPMRTEKRSEIVEITLN
jgi:predicted MPP superfamily phosphohydrolase